MNESNFQSLFTAWCKKNWKWGSAAIELKITNTKSLPFSRLEEHQEVSLLKAENGILVHKISDLSPGFKPLDMVIMQGSPAYVCIMFYKPRKKKVCYLIPINCFLSFRSRHNRKSITESDALKIGERIEL